MKQSLKNTVVICDLEHILLNNEGNLSQTFRDVLQLYSTRGGRFTVFSQRTPSAVRNVMGSVRLTAPALTCGGSLLYNFADGSSRAIRSFEELSMEFLEQLPVTSGMGISFQMVDGMTRIVRMSQTLEAHLRQEWTQGSLGRLDDSEPKQILRILVYADKSAQRELNLLERSLRNSTRPLVVERQEADLLVLTPRGVTGKEMMRNFCTFAEAEEQNVIVVAGGSNMIELMTFAGKGVTSADAPKEVVLAAQSVTFLRQNEGAAEEYLYSLIQEADKKG